MLPYATSRLFQREYLFAVRIALACAARHSAIRHSLRNGCGPGEFDDVFQVQHLSVRVDVNAAYTTRYGPAWLAPLVILTPRFVDVGAEGNF